MYHVDFRTTWQFRFHAQRIIISNYHYLFSDWPKAHSKFFGNQRLGRHLAADYTIIMSRTLKVIGNHVMYDCGAWFLRVIMSSLDALCCSKVIGNWHFACFVLLEVIGNHVMYDRGAWFPRVIMSSLHALCCCCQWIEEAKTWLTVVTIFFCSMYNKTIYT